MYNYKRTYQYEAGLQLTSNIPTTVLTEPTNLRISNYDNENKRITLTWDAPDSNGGFPITGYVITYSVNNKTWAPYESVFPYKPPAGVVPTFNMISGEINGNSVVFQKKPGLVDDIADNTVYYLSVFSGNERGLSSVPATITLKTSSVPSIISDLGFTNAPDERQNLMVDLKWTDPVNTGGNNGYNGPSITMYNLYYRKIPDTVWTKITLNKSNVIISSSGSQSRRYVLRDLMNQSKYEIKIEPINSVGVGPESAIVTARTLMKPGVPSNVIITSKYGLLPPTISDISRNYINITWNKPDSGGSAIKYYNITITPPSNIGTSITYPYNVSEVTVNDKRVPKCVFYTSEFAWLNEGYFTLGGGEGFKSDDQVTDYLKKHPEIYFTAPSVWSAQGISKYNVPDSRNRVITHGVDTSIFYLQANRSQRKAVREFYRVKETDILLINIGAMTGNKGMMLILQVLHELVNKRNHREFKLLLKGTGDLYSSKQFLESYFEQLQRESALSKADTDNLLTNHIIFSDKTLSYSRINDLFNAADLYISPYLAEGFNLTVLESLAAGLPVLVPETGSTREYINDISNSGLDTSKYVIKLRSQVGKHPSGMLQNVIELSDLIYTLINNRGHIQNMKEQRYVNYYDLQRYISTHYSWRRVVELLYEYLYSIGIGNSSSSPNN
ncbi:MAG: glycosyltransferase [Proteobacteria bacterium]|nr:glycosyltransferase [Pseudomonadota bacterium]